MASILCPKFQVGDCLGEMFKHEPNFANRAYYHYHVNARFPIENMLATNIARDISVKSYRLYTTGYRLDSITRAAVMNSSNIAWLVNTSEYDDDNRPEDLLILYSHDGKWYLATMIPTPGQQKTF